MAATCVMRPVQGATENDCYRPKIPQTTTNGWVEKKQSQFQCASEVRIPGTYSLKPKRYGLHTANSTPPTKLPPTSRITDSNSNIHSKVSVLVAALLASVARAPTPYGSFPDHDTTPQLPDEESLASACIISDSTAPQIDPHRSRTLSSKPFFSGSPADMDFSIDFDSTSGFKSHVKKKKAAAATKFDPWGENEEQKEEAPAGGGGSGDAGAGGSGGHDAGAGGGGEDNNGGGGDDDDAWGFSTGKKKAEKKKSKKKQEEEEEEEEEEKSRKKEGEAPANTADPLSWADDANDEAGAVDWTMSWGGPKKDAKKKKAIAPPAVPDAPPATSAFQEISLDDGAPNLDFSFDNLGGETKKSDSGGAGFGTWGSKWDFGTVGKEEKKEAAPELGTNNPWGFGGSKSKKKTTTSGFDFGDFTTSGTNELSFDGNEVAESKADDAWGFGGKRDKKEKATIEEIQGGTAEQPAKEENWGGWAGAKSKTKKKGAFDDAFSIEPEHEAEPEPAPEPSFGWGFGTKTKKKVEEEKPKEDHGEDWTSGTWGGNKSKKKTDELSTSVDLDSNGPALLEHDTWGAVSTGKKDKKKGKKGLLDDGFALSETPEPSAPDEPPPPLPEPMVAWDLGLSMKDKKKKEKQMKLEGTWDDRVTQDMVDAQKAEATAAAAAVVVELQLEPILEPLPVEEKVAWDHDLDAKKRRKKEKDMKLDGTWESRITQEMIDDEKAAAETGAAYVVPDPDSTLEPEPDADHLRDETPLEDMVPWDHLLSPKEKKKKEKDLRATGEWDDRLTQDKIDQMIFDRDNAALAPEPEPEPEPIPPPEEIPLEDLVPWDYMLGLKEKKKKEKELKANFQWDDRLTQEKLDQMILDRDNAFAEPELESEPMPPPPPPPPPPAGETESENLVPWDYKLGPKEKKKKEKEMRADGTWDDRLTQSKIDDMNVARDAAAIEPEPRLEAVGGTVPEDLVSWDHGLNAKEKKKKEKELRAAGEWDGRLTQEYIHDLIAAKPVAPEPEPESEPMLEPEITADVETLEEAEALVPWDYNLNTSAKKKKQKQMQLEGSWDSRLTQEIIDDRIAAAKAAATSAGPEVIPQAEDEPDPIVEEEPRLPWDHGLTLKEKKKKEKEMKLDGIWEDRLTQDQIDADEAARAVALEAEPEPLPEEPATPSWSFGWGGSKTKVVEKRSLLDPEPEKPEEKPDNGWGGSWSLGLGKDKKKAKTSEPEPEPTVEPEPEPEPAPVIEEKFPWDHGLTKVQMRKMEKQMKLDGTWNDRLTQEKIDEEAAMVLSAAVESEPIPEAEPEPVKDDLWGLGPSKIKKKDKGAKKSDLFEPPVEDPVPEPPPVEDDMFAAFSKPVDKKVVKKGKKTIEKPPPPVPSPPALDFRPEAEPEAPLLSVDEFSWGGLDTGKKSNKSLAEELPAKKGSGSLWGFGSSTSTAKTKKEKETKAKKGAEDEAKQQEEERLQEAEAAAKAAAEAEEAAKAKKTAKSGKLLKSSKVGDTKKSSDLIDMLDESVPTPSSSKLKKTSTRGSDKKLDDVLEDQPEANQDYFSFWGGSGNAKKTPGKKSTDNKKEIKLSVSTNKEDALLAGLNEDEIQALLEDAPAPSLPKLTKIMSTDKKSSSFVADRIKAFDPPNEAVGKKSKSASATLINEEAELVTLTPKEAKKAARGKTSKIGDQPLPPPIEAEQKKSKDSIPGGFPGAFDEDLLADELLPAGELMPEKSKAKNSSKVEKKATPKTTKKKTTTFEEPEPDSIDLLDELEKLPTPLPEDGKPAKKERARVERSATASWGFWGAAAPPPKKPVRSKTVDDISPPASKKPKSFEGTIRSKSKSKDKDIEASKTSGSDKEDSAKPNRPAPSRGMSFTSWMAPPTAMRNPAPLRRSSTSASKSSSRRQSMVDSGLMSPPPDDPVSKAARLMGFSDKPLRRSSVKDKSKSYVDPYPIDDDDMVMINANDKMTPSKPKSKVITSVRKSSTKPRSKTISGDEDVVMVDSPLALDSANEDLEKPHLQRNSTGRKSLFGFGGFFGAKAMDRTRSTPATDNEDNIDIPVRSRGNSRRRSLVMSPADGFTTDVPGETDADVAKADRRARRVAAERAREEEDRAAREERRRERRDREKADLEARREKAREQARKEREAEDQRKEERRARRREKEAAERERIAQEEAEAEAAAEKRREERRALREKLEAEAAVRPLTRDDRRRTYAGDEDARKERKSRTKQSSGSRRSTVLMAEYHESRSGSGRGIKPPENKTSSWIDSQKDLPPEAPPIEPTVLDASGEVARPVADGDSGSRKKHRKDKYAGMTEDEIMIARAKRRERRIVEKSTSGGSDEKMDKKSKRQSRVYEDDYYAAEPVRTFDGRPSTSKRSSFLGKFF